MEQAHVLDEAFMPLADDVENRQLQPARGRKGIVRP